MCGGSSFHAQTEIAFFYGRDIVLQMPDASEKNYRWPWFVLAAFLLAVLLAVLWMSFAVRHERQERDLNAPLPDSAPR